MNTQSENINELMGALSKAQGKMSSAKKDKQNPYFKSSYADLSSVMDACRSALSENGLAVTQPIEIIDQKMVLVTILAHSSGQWIKSYMPIITTKSDPQGFGSALTYYRRYALSALVGVAAAEDDDGNAACGLDDTKPKSNSPKTEPIKQPTISKQKGDELSQLLGECDVKYQNQVLASIKNMGFGSLYDVNEETYSKIKTAALRKREETTVAVGE